MFENILVESALAVLIFGGMLWGLYASFNHRFWGVRLRGIFKKPFALVFSLVALTMISIAFLDAISWRDNIPAGEVATFAAKEPRSILDRIFSRIVSVPEYAYREKSYSAPLATHEFVDTDIQLDYRHLFGTTQTGYDTLYQCLKGCKPAVVIGSMPLMFAVPLAMLFGITAGYFGGRVDDFVVYLYSTIASIPGLLLLIALITVLGPSVFSIALGLGLRGWISLCRLTRGETMKLRELEYIQAARSLGVSAPKIIMRHIVPNVMHIVLIVSILAFTGLVLSEAILAYIGIGLEHSWGGMVNEARSEVSRDPAIWWNIVAASGALFLLVLSINVVGDAVRDVLDPKVSSS
jgi:peptide/nickel transport system permease protein